MTSARLISRAFSLSLILIALLRVNSFGATYLQQNEDNIIMGNNTLEVSLSRADGTIRSLLNKQDTVDYCRQVVERVWPVPNVPVGERIGGVMVYDELRQKLFSDLEDSVQLLEMKAEKNDAGVTITLAKKFESAEFLLRQRLVMQEDHLRWEVEAVKLSGPDRSLKIALFTPQPIWGYTCWAPIAEAPFESNPWPPFQINFGQMDGGSVGNTNWRTVIPMVVFYSRNKQKALCMVSPLEVQEQHLRGRGFPLEQPELLGQGTALPPGDQRVPGPQG